MHETMPRLDAGLPRPRRGLVVGCGVMLVGVLLGMLLLFGFGFKKLQHLNQIAVSFVEVAAGGDPAAAWQDLHKAAQQRVDVPQFVAQWVLFRDLVGELQEVTPTGGTGMDPEEGVLLLGLQVVGSKATKEIIIGLNPNDEPPQVLYYELPVEVDQLKSTEDAPSPEAEPAAEPAEPVKN